MTALLLFIGAGGMTEDRGGFRLSSPSQARFRNSSRLAAPQDPPTQILGLSLTSGRHEKRLPKDAGAVFEQAACGGRVLPTVFNQQTVGRRFISR